MSRPSVLAVFKLITSSIFVDRMTVGHFAIENSPGVDADLTIGIGYAGPLAHPRHDGLARGVARRDAEIEEIATASVFTLFSCFRA